MSVPDIRAADCCFTCRHTYNEMYKTDSCNRHVLVTKFGYTLSTNTRAWMVCPDFERATKARTLAAQEAQLVRVRR